MEETHVGLGLHNDALPAPLASRPAVESDTKATHRPSKFTVCLFTSWKQQKPLPEPITNTNYCARVCMCTRTVCFVLCACPKIQHNQALVELKPNSLPTQALHM